MSYFRPPQSSSAVVWAGRAAAAIGVTLGVVGLMAATAPGGIAAAWAATSFASGGGALAALNTFSPLWLGIGSAAAVLLNSEKAAEVNRDNGYYQRRLQNALSQGRSETHLEPRMLDQRRQKSILTTGLGTVAAIAWVGFGTMCLLGAGLGGFEFPIKLAQTFGLAANAGPALAAAVGGISLFAGVASWKVASVAAEARDFADSREASAERARIAKERTRGPAPTHATARHATPLSDMIDRQLKVEERQADHAMAKGAHVARLEAARASAPGLAAR